MDQEKIRVPIVHVESLNGTDAAFTDDVVLYKAQEHKCYQSIIALLKGHVRLVHQAEVSSG